MVWSLYGRHVVVADVVDRTSTDGHRNILHELLQCKIIQVSKIIYEEILMVVFFLIKIHILEDNAHVRSVSESRICNVC